MGTLPPCQCEIDFLASFLILIKSGPTSWYVIKKRGNLQSIVLTMTHTHTQVEVKKVSLFCLFKIKGDFFYVFHVDVNKTDECQQD